MYVKVDICVYFCECICIYICIYKYVCICVCTYAHVYVHVCEGDENVTRICMFVQIYTAEAVSEYI